MSGVAGRIAARLDEVDTGIAVADFLLARLAEDYDTAYGGAPSPWLMGESHGGINGAKVLDKHGEVTAACYYGGTLGHVLRFDPTAVLADIDAKRAVVERCLSIDWGLPSQRLAFSILGDLAAAYRSHPDYDERWRAVTTRPVTQTDVACAYRDRIAELEGQLAAARAGCGAGREGEG